MIKEINLKNLRRLDFYNEEMCEIKEVITHTKTVCKPLPSNTGCCCKSGFPNYIHEYKDYYNPPKTNLPWDVWTLKEEYQDKVNRPSYSIEICYKTYIVDIKKSGTDYAKKMVKKYEKLIKEWSELVG